MAAFFGLLAFLGAAAFRTFFAAGAAALEVVADAEDAAGADDEVEVAVDLGFAALALLLLAAFFFGAAAFFFGLLALPADFGLAAAFDFGLAVVAFLALVDAFFLLALAEAVAVAGAAATEALAVDATAVAGFLAATSFVGEAERFRFVPPAAADFGLLDDRAFFVVVPAAFLLPPGVFDRLLGFALAGFFADEAVFFLPAAEVFFFAGAAAPNLKLPLAPTPLVCFNELFFVPARNADFRC